jgi:hypothetical protein
VILDTRIAARGDRRVESPDHRSRGARTAVTGADAPPGERVDPATVQDPHTPLDLVVLMVVREVTGVEGKAQARPSPAGVGHGAARVGVDVAHRCVEGLWAERLLGAPHADGAARSRQLKARRRRFVGELGVAELGEERERAAPCAARLVGPNVARDVQLAGHTRRADGQLSAGLDPKRYRLVERGAPGGIAGRRGHRHERRGEHEEDGRRAAHAQASGDA